MTKSLSDVLVEIIKDGILSGLLRDRVATLDGGAGLRAPDGDGHIGNGPLTAEQWADERAKNIVNQLQLVLAESPTEIDQIGAEMQALDLSVTIQSPEVKRHPVDGGRPITRSFIAHASIGMPPRRSMVKVGARLSLVLGQVIAAAKEDLT